MIDADGVGVIQLTDTAVAPAARAVVQRVFVSVPAIRAGRLRITRVEYSFESLAGWRELLAAEPLPGAQTMVDIDEAANRLVVGVEASGDVQFVRGSLEARGIPGNALVVKVAASPVPLSTLASPVRPTMGGLQIVSAFAGCTLGFKAKFSGSSTRYFVTNAHCTQAVGQVDGGAFGQPLLQTNYRIGYEYTDPAFQSGAGCTGLGCRYADAALIRYDSTSFASTTYTLAQTLYAYTGTDPDQSGSTDLSAEPFWVTGEVSDTSLLVGTVLNKVGATSGWTSGPIYRTCVNWNAYGGTLKCQYDVNGVGRGGDSGSPVFTYDAYGRAALAGLLWASGLAPDSTASFTFSPLSGVKQDLGALIVSSPVY